MPREKITLLMRAKWDLQSAEILLAAESGDDGIVEVAAYHCQQCVEEVVKYLIQLQGSSYAPSHETEEYLEDLDNEQVKELVNKIGARIDRWNNRIRYHYSRLSNRNAVSEVIAVCRELVKIAENEEPLPITGKDGEF